MFDMEDPFLFPKEPSYTSAASAVPKKPPVAQVPDICRLPRRGGAMREIRGDHPSQALPSSQTPASQLPSTTPPGRAVRPLLFQKTN
jgi:hypothetical protein